MSKDKKDEKESMGKLEELFLKSRTIMLYGEINQKVAREFCTKIQLLAAESDDAINVFVNSPGGHVESGDSIHDMIKFVKPRVKVIGTGWVASAGALIYSAPPVEDRFSLPNTRYMLHQHRGGVHLGGEPVGRCLVGGDDGLAVARPSRVHMPDGLVQVVDHTHG